MESTAMDSHTALLVTLADMFSGKQVEPQIVAAALQRICQTFSFECGLLYGIDQYNTFHLKESFLPAGKQVRQQFAVEEINPTFRKQLATDSLTYVQDVARTGPCEAALLHIFGAGSLVLVSVVDENTRIFGLIIFTHSGPKNMPPEDLAALRIIIPMLSRYVGIRMYQNKLAFAQSSLESILDNAGIDIYVNDFYTHEVLYVNKSMAAPYGGREVFMAHKCWKILFPHQSGPCTFCPQHKLVDSSGNPTKVYTWDYQRSFDGAWFRVFSAAFRWVDGRLAHVVSSADITDNKRNEELIQYLANYDSLTKLPNRRKLVSDCTQILLASKAGESCYLLFFDIDGFKAINDRLGHEAGDEFLVQLGEFFTSNPMLKDCTYRNGGDEFVALLTGDVSEAKIRTLAAQIHERFKKVWMLKMGDVVCNTSIGVACYPKDATSTEELLRKADQAMYRVKNNGGGDICFS